VAHPLDEALAAYDASDLSVRLVTGLCSVVPFAPSLSHWASVADGVRLLRPEARRDTLDRALELADEEGARKALWVLSQLDTADAGLGAVGGLAAAWKLYQAKTNTERLEALETDPQQAADAVIKGLAIAWAVHRLFPGGPAAKIDALRETDAGNALILVYATVDLGLPFADNALLGAGSLLSNLHERYGADAMSRLTALAGGDESDGVRSVFDRLLEPVGSLAASASQHLGPVAAQIAAAAPGTLAAGDRVAGIAATAADLLPVYRYLGARLVAEACVRRALAESPADTPVTEGLPERQTPPPPPVVDPSQVPIKVTRGADDLPETPRKSGCFGFFVALFCAFAAAAWSAV
jgi:hypothetical protein